MPVIPRSSHGRSRTAPPKPAGFGQTSDRLAHYRQIAAMATLLDRLPGAGDARPAYRDEIAALPHDDLWRDRDGLDPLTRRAFDAVVAGLDKLAESAADLCDHDHAPLTPVEMEACAAIGKSMRQLLRRAAALVEPPQGRDAGQGRATPDEASRRRENKN
jgi:hypothetical protein